MLSLYCHGCLQTHRETQKRPLMHYPVIVHYPVIYLSPVVSMSLLKKGTMIRKLFRQVGQGIAIDGSEGDLAKFN